LGQWVSQVSHFCVCNIVVGEGLGSVGQVSIRFECTNNGKKPLSLVHVHQLAKITDPLTQPICRIFVGVVPEKLHPLSLLIANANALGIIHEMDGREHSKTVALVPRCVASPETPRSLR